jgi:hypothetical protein
VLHNEPFLKWRFSQFSDASHYASDHGTGHHFRYLFTNRTGHEGLGCKLDGGDGRPRATGGKRCIYSPLGHGPKPKCTEKKGQWWALPGAEQPVRCVEALAPQARLLKGGTIHDGDSTPPTHPALTPPAPITHVSLCVALTICDDGQETDHPFHMVYGACAMRDLEHETSMRPTEPSPRC